MIADWFLTGDDLSFLTDTVTSFFSYGIGLGVVLFIIGWMVHFVKQLVMY